LARPRRSSSWLAGRTATARRGSSRRVTWAGRRRWPWAATPRPRPMAQAMRRPDRSAQHRG